MRCHITCLNSVRWQNLDSDGHGEFSGKSGYLRYKCLKFLPVKKVPGWEWSPIVRLSIKDPDITFSYVQLNAFL